MGRFDMIEGGEKIITHCPICGYPLPEPTAKKTLMFSFSICDCCGCEYGADDTPLYREAWLRNGAPWFNGAAPASWDVNKQLEHAQMDWNIDVEQL
jgi:hypothetical protein